MCCKRCYSWWVLLIPALFGCKEHTMFSQVSPAKSGIHFNNLIKETDSVNILDLSNVYNGGGVAIADFNNDSLQDIFFTGNMVSNKMYLNKGDLHFNDITEQAGTDGAGRWCRGAVTIDINNDGWMDLYVCTSMNIPAFERQNLLYINECRQIGETPHFREMATEYGLNDTSYTTMANFFDYDNDGDLDVFLAVNQIMEGEYPNKFRALIKDGTFPSTCRLLRNDWNSTLNHSVFTNVSKQAGINIEGYTHGAVVADINKDGWKDVFVTNDYLSCDVLYINNHDGTFTDKAGTYFKHTSANAMGQDIIDINNDGLQDIFVLDMNPEDDFRKKMMLNPSSYQTYQNSDYFGYQYQYVRNVLQLNQGPRINSNDSIGDPVFSDIAFLAGVAETDWSWAPLITDFDNDGFRDIIVTNGFPKDVTDHDFVAFRDKAFFVATKQQLLSQIPEVKLTNYAFKNNGDLGFSDVSLRWGITTPSFSNGAAYADLDNDGDMDYVVNNINDEASLFENHARDDKAANHFIKINFSGAALNINGIGAWVEIHYDHGKQQVYEHTPYRGYLSSVEAGAHFGLGNMSLIDSMIIQWPDGKMQVMKDIAADQVITVSHKNANEMYVHTQLPLTANTLFKDVTAAITGGIENKDDDFIDFNIQKLLPHKLSSYGPALSAADINNDGLDDIVMGGAYGYSAQILTQNTFGQFAVRELTQGADRQTKTWEDMGILLFDADSDGDEDMYIAAGSYESDPNTNHYQDRLYVNDGKGNFRFDSLALPQNFTSKSCVRTVDIDNDNDLDIFVAGRCVPSRYPSPVSCFIYRNDSKKDRISFTDITARVCPALKDIGMTCDAVWTDYDNDGMADLVIAGEFMPLRFFHNDHGKMVLQLNSIDNQAGWWNSIIAADFDNDGDMDFVAGNTGANSFYKPTNERPVHIYAKDFDNNGSFDALPSLYLPASQKDTAVREYPAQLRDDLIKQMIEMRNKFKTYNEFATASFDKLLTPEQLKGALILSANNFKSSYIRNDGGGKFTMAPLPIEAQLSTVYGMIAEDTDGDGNLDIIINGNDFGTEVTVGRYDAMNGLVLKGDGNGNFAAMRILQSGIFIPGNGKALIKFKNANGNCMLAASQNRGSLKIFQMKSMHKTIPLRLNDKYAMITLANGKKRKVECNFGMGYLSQSSRFINMDASMKSIEIFDNNGKGRVVE